MTTYTVTNTANNDTHTIEDSSMIGAIIRTEGMAEISGMTLLPRDIESGRVNYMDEEGGEYAMVITAED